MALYRPLFEWPTADDLREGRGKSPARNGSAPGPLASEGTRRRRLFRCPMRRATDRESADPEEPVAVPAGEMPADLMLDMKCAAESLSAYQSALQAAPNRFDALLGAARAADALGAATQTRDYYRQLVAVAAPDADRPEVETARAYLAKWDR